MIEAVLLIMTIGSMVLLLRNSTRRETEDPDELLGLFAYKQEKGDRVIKRRPEHKRNA